MYHTYHTVLRQARRSYQHQSLGDSDADQTVDAEPCSDGRQKRQQRRHENSVAENTGAAKFQRQVSRWELQKRVTVVEGSQNNSCRKERTLD